MFAGESCYATPPRRRPISDGHEGGILFLVEKLPHLNYR